MFLTVVIPAYNEAERLPKTLEKVKDYLVKQSYEWEILVVNDGSTDETVQVIEELIKRWNLKAVGSPFAFSHPSQPTTPAGGDRHFAQGIPSGLRSDKFRLINNKENRGKGAVVKQGMLEAKGDWRLFMDADNSTDISEIEKLWKYTASSRQHLQTTGSSRPSEASLPTRSASALDHAPRPARVSLEDTDSFQTYEIVIGSRYLNKDSIKIKQPFMRRFVSRMGNILVRILLGIKSVDTQCGFKLFSKKAAQDIFPLQTIDRWGFDMEILAIAIRKGYKIKEAAVDWYDAEGSQVKKSAALKTLKELWEIKINLIKRKYR